MDRRVPRLRARTSTIEPLFTVDNPYSYTIYTCSPLNQG